MTARRDMNWHYEISGRIGGKPLVLVHGFFGTLHAWDSLLPMLEEPFRILRVDLPGHGDTPVPPAPLDLREAGAMVGQLIGQVFGERALLCGYSMGGRIALHTALSSPATISGLVLIGASPGIEDITERSARRTRDMELAGEIRRRGIEWFNEFWLSQPLFAHLPAHLRESLKRQRATADPEGLAFALENLGAGTQDYLVPELAKIRCPVLLLAGEKDRKYSVANRVMEKSFLNAHVQRKEIANAGHSVHLENPQAVTEAIVSFAQTL